MRVAVIGAGASGLMAAQEAASRGAETYLFEKNEKCGKKIYITGKGRCNLTNDIEPDEFLSHVVNNPKFLTGCIYAFPPRKTMEFFEDAGLRLKKERGGRVFPESDKASDVTKCLVSLCGHYGVKTCLDTEVKKVLMSDGRVTGIRTEGGDIPFVSVIVCCGGKTYPATGSTGDGYRFALEAGHSIVTPKPSLCGLNIKGDMCPAMQGLSLKNVALTYSTDGKRKKTFFGEMLFTHFGISGPIALILSAYINREDLAKVTLSLDFKPAMDEETLDRRILRDFSEGTNRNAYNALKGLLPQAAIRPVLEKAGIDPSEKVNAVTRAERHSLLTALKNFDMIVESLRGFDEAVVTSGGVRVSEINPKTMESRICSGLYFCGETLDTDALTGGYNLQIAFSTGRAAGIAAAGRAVQ